MTITTFVVEATEFERGWGQRPDGIVCFENEAAADAFIVEQNKSRPAAVPDFYVNYTKIGYKECSRRILVKILENGRLWVNNSKDLKIE